MAYPRQRVYLPIKAWLGFFSHLFSGKLFSGGSLRQFEQKYADFIGIEYAISVPSGRKGLQNVLQALELNPGAEVVVPAFTYPAVPFVIEQAGYKVRFVDCELNSFGLDSSALEKLLSTPHHIEAVIPTHLYGVPCDIEKIQAICQKHKLYIIEDCAHCGETYVATKKTGSFSDIAYFSFETSKSINTLGGGMLVTSSPQMAEKLKKLQQQETQNSMTHLFKRLLKSSFEALVTQPTLFSLFIYPALRGVDLISNSDDAISKKYIGKDITLKGRTFAYSNYQAWLGLQQIDLLKSVTKKRIDNANLLSQLLSSNIQCQQAISSQHQPNWLLFSILLNNKEKTASQLLKQGVDTKRDYMRDCSQLFPNPLISEEDQVVNYPNAKRLDSELIHLPCYPELSVPDINLIAGKVLSQASSSNDAIS